MWREESAELDHLESGKSIIGEGRAAFGLSALVVLGQSEPVQLLASPNRCPFSNISTI